MPVQCNTINTSDVCLNVCLLPSSSLSFVYYIVYIAPFSLSIVKDHRGVSSTSFKYSFQPAAESCICYRGVFLPGTLKLGPYGPPTVGRQAQEVEFGGWLACRRAHLPGRHYRLAEFVCSVAVGGMGVENDRKGIKLTAQARYER